MYLTPCIDPFSRAVTLQERVAAMTRIMVVDDHSMVRKQLRQVIQEREGWEVCGEASDGQEAIRLHTALKPHVTVMDFNMPLLDGLQAARQILSNQPSASILMISISDARQLIEEMKKIGVKGFCLKRDIDDLFAAVEALLRGETYFSERSD
jgi:DNA-binding NarL/FixJ family response regulator